MSILTMAARLTAFLFFEGDREYSRKLITVASGAGVLEAGHVMGAITASGKFVEYDTGNVDGSEVAAAILLETIDATAADVEAVALVRFGIVKTNGLSWFSGASAGDKTDGLADLEALNPPILSRDAV